MFSPDTRPNFHRPPPLPDPVSGRSFDPESLSPVKQKLYGLLDGPTGAPLPGKGFYISPAGNYVAATEPGEGEILRSFGKKEGLKIILDHGSDQVVLGQKPYTKAIEEIVILALESADYHADQSEPPYAPWLMFDNHYGITNPVRYKRKDIISNPRGSAANHEGKRYIKKEFSKEKYKG